ncbi:MAG: esterase, partial [Roseiarcus sp.]
VNVIDLTGVASNDSANHSKFATSEVVAAIGDRLAQGQALNDAQPGVVESLGVFTHGAISIAADAATAPTRIVDQTASEKSIDTAAGSVTLDK